MCDTALRDVLQAQWFCSSVVGCRATTWAAEIGKIRLVSPNANIKALLQGLTSVLCDRIHAWLQADSAAARVALRYILCIQTRDSETQPHVVKALAMLVNCMPRVHDYTTTHEVQHELRAYCKRKYRDIGVTGLALKVLEHKWSGAYGGQAHELALHLLRAATSGVDSELCLLFDFENMTQEIQERLCVAVCALYYTATKDRLLEITTVYLLEALTRIHFSPTVFNTLVSRLGQCVEDGNYFMAQCIHGSMSRVIMKMTEPYALAQYLAQHDVVEHILIQYHDHCYCENVEIHTSYTSLITHMIHSMASVPVDLYGKIYQVRVRAAAPHVCVHAH